MLARKKVKFIRRARTYINVVNREAVPSFANSDLTEAQTLNVSSQSVNEGYDISDCIIEGLYSSMRMMIL